ncbi:hypothetical protein CYY_003814 [Polysphondylium violaceum]|uniref:RING-type domain-containing protein n=1 Tax=Polysphondylium violaceum TaxID=133409 RepID=A0A8J4UZW0_9MYCE|nr:hypothetical protein CYY_003814 [Polysphondylium violaceum]
MNFMKDDECIQCHNDLYLNPTMKLLTAPCGHKYCESCVSLNYMKDSVINCLGCNAQIRRQSFINSRFDDTGLEKENGIRKKVLRVFNKCKDDYTNLVDFNNYLEMVEDIIFDMLEGGESAVQAEAKLKEYQKLNQGSIIINKKKKEEEDALIAQRISEEQRIIAERRNFYLAQDQEEQKKKLLENAKTIDDLAKGKITAKDVKELDKKKAEELRQMAKGPDLSQLVPPTADKDKEKEKEKNKFIYQPKQQNQQQPQQNNNNNNNNNNQQQQLPPGFSEPQPLEEFKYDELSLKNLIPTAQQSEVAGFKQIYIKQRAFEEAFQLF